MYKTESKSQKIQKAFGGNWSKQRHRTKIYFSGLKLYIETESKTEVKKYKKLYLKICIQWYPIRSLNYSLKWWKGGQNGFIKTMELKHVLFTIQDVIFSAWYKNEQYLYSKHTFITWVLSWVLQNVISCIWSWDLSILCLKWTFNLSWAYAEWISCQNPTGIMCNTNTIQTVIGRQSHS